MQAKSKQQVPAPYLNDVGHPRPPNFTPLLHVIKPDVTNGMKRQYRFLNFRVEGYQRIRINAIQRNEALVYIFQMLNVLLLNTIF